MWINIYKFILLYKKYKQKFKIVEAKVENMPRFNKCTCYIP